jgi:hypothetical protein
LIDVAEKATDDGRSQMTGMERFRDVGGGELDDDALFPLGMVRGVFEAILGIEAERGSVIEDGGNDDFGEGSCFEEELEERSGDGRPLNERRLGELDGHEV